MPVFNVIEMVSVNTVLMRCRCGFSAVPVAGGFTQVDSRAVSIDFNDTERFQCAFSAI